MRIAVLGPLQVRTSDGASVVVPGAKERLILAVLAAGFPAVVSADRLVETVWDGAPPATARRSLQAHVVRLRSALEPGRPPGSPGRYVLRRGTGYVLAIPPLELDVSAAGELTARGRAQLAAGDAEEAARLLTQAVDLWRGEPYADWPDAPFADAERTRLGEVRAGTVTALVEARLALGGHAEVVPDLERLLADDPLHEEWWRLLALALYRCGRQGAALAATRRARRVLAEDLGADPGPRLRAMEAAVLAHDPALDPPPPGGRHDVGSCPYKGLATYEATDSALFHGRDRVVNRLVARLVDAPLAVVSGPSGAGKSSVVRAGLVPALARGALPDSREWRPVLVTPGRRPSDVLTDLPENLTGPVLLVCDQAEELWAPGVDPAARAAFLDRLLALIDRGVAVRCVVVLRADHVGRLAEHAAFTERLGDALVLVPAMTGEELRAVVVEPARSVGLTVDREFVDSVVADVLGRPGALPLLSTALVGTWERRRGRRLTLAGYLEAGGVAGAVGRSAEEAFGELTDEGKAAARGLLVRLAGTDGAGALVRQPQLLADLDLDGARGGHRRAVVATFLAHRLLAVDGEYLDVAHEALLTAWPRLSRWLDDDAVGRAVRRHLAPAAHEWQRGGEREDELYRGPRLAAALDWSAGVEADLTQVERRFLDASRARADAELTAARDRARGEAAARRRTRRLAGALAVMLVLALVGTGLAVRAQRAAEDASTVADAHRLAALATTVGSLDVSLLLAAQAVELAGTPDAQDGLLAALTANGRAQRAVPFSGELRAASLGGNGGMLFLTGRRGFEYWRVGPATQPRRLMDVPGEWGDVLTVDAAPTEEVLFVVGTSASHPWVRRIRPGGVDEMVVEGQAIGGVALAGAFDAEGRWFHLLLATPGSGGAPPLSDWRVIDVDPASGTTRATGVSGRVAAPVDALAARFADDGSSFVLWDEAGTAPSTAVSMVDGRRVDLSAERRPGVGGDFLALPWGTAHLWEDGAVTLHDLTGTAVQQLDLPGGPVRDVVVSPDGTWAATVGGGSAVVLWDVDHSTGHWSQRAALSGHNGDVLAAEVDPVGQRLYTVATDNTVIAWDMSVDGGFGEAYPGLRDRWISGRPELTGPDGLLVAPTRGGAGAGDPSATPAGDSRTVAATFLDPATGAVVDEVLVGETGAAAGFLSSVSVSPDQRMVAVTWGLGATVLEVATREVVTRIDPDGASVLSAGWTPDGSRLLLGMHGRVPAPGAGQLVAVDTTTWRVDRAIDVQGSARAIEPSPDGRVVAVASNVTPSVVVLDATTLAVTRTVPLPTQGLVLDMAFAADGGLLAVGDDAGLLHVVDTATWSPTTPPITVHEGRALQVEWWDDRTVVTAGDDGVASLVDVERGLVRARPLPGSEVDGRGATHLLLLVPRELVTLSGERAGRRYPMEPSVWLDQACAIAGRDLTRAEWARYLPDRGWEPTCSDRS
ncbi:BTAD domain-containing putative transcriptional regulator [Geodermatophilus sp. SYSU D00691]